MLASVLHCHGCGPDHSGVVAKLGGQYWRLSNKVHGQLSENSPSWTEIQIAQLGNSSTDDHHVRVQKIDGNCNAPPEIATGFGHYFPGLLIASDSIFSH